MLQDENDHDRLNNKLRSTSVKKGSENIVRKQASRDHIP
jgi:hypothetical protein